MHPRPLPSALRGRAFGLRAAEQSGVPTGRLRRLDLVTPTRGLRWPAADPPDGIERIRAIRPILLPGQFVSHTSAALLWGLPLPARFEHPTPIHVTSRAPRAAMVRPDVVGHRVRPATVAVRPRWGLPVSSPATTWVECGELLGPDTLIALGDAIVGRPALRTTIEDLRVALTARRGCRGARRLRDALQLIRVGAHSRKETEMRLVLVRAGFPEPELQLAVTDQKGNVLGHADMGYPQQRLLIEYEGDHHRTDEHQWREDVRRHREFARAGWFTLRVTKRDLDLHLASTLQVVAEHLDMTASPLPNRRARTGELPGVRW